MMSNRAAKLAHWRQDRRLREIDVLSRAGRLPEAVACAQAAAEAGLDHPMVLSVLAWDRRQAGVLDEAIAIVRRALELDPGEPALLLSLGGHLAADGRPREALEAFEAVLQAVPEQADALTGKARALLRLGAYDEAEALLHRALDQAPNDTDAIAALAGLACQRGDNAGACELSGRILDLEPDNTEAALVLAEAAVADQRHEDAEARLRPQLERPNLLPLDRATAFSILGDALHGRGRFGEAFEAYEAANAGYREVHRPRFEAPGLERETDRAARLIREFKGADPRPWRSSALDDAPDEFPEHLFLIGFPRSGTTLLENIFGAHPDVVALDEIPTLADAVRDYFSDDDGLDRLAGAGQEELEAHRQVHATKVRAARTFEAPKLLLEKLPLFGLHIPLIRKLFPRAKIVFALRDPRDVVLSCFRRRFLINSAMYEFTELADAARFYDRVMTLSETYVELIDPDVFLIRNEDLIGDFEGWARQLCDFAGLAWSERVHDFAEAARKKDIRTPSANQVRRGLNPEGVGQWRAYRDQLEPVMAELEPWVRSFDYPMD